MRDDDEDAGGAADDHLPPELVAEFRARLGRDARRLAALRDGLAAAGAPPLARDPGWAELDRLVHRLVGAGGTYGFPEVSAAAEDVERLTGLSAGLLVAAEVECRRLALIAVERLRRVLEESRGGEGDEGQEERGRSTGIDRRRGAAER